jgi:hypothetical protein
MVSQYRNCVDGQRLGIEPSRVNDNCEKRRKETKIPDTVSCVAEPWDVASWNVGAGGDGSEGESKSGATKTSRCSEYSSAAMALEAEIPVIRIEKSSAGE